MIFGVKIAEADDVSVEGRTVKAVIGRVDVVDRDNELIVGETYQVNDLQASRWMHNSMPHAKARGLTRDVEPAVGFGRGWVDGDKVIAEIKALRGERGDEFLDYIREGGKSIRYSQGFTMPRDGAVKRDDGVMELHNVTCWEMSPVPDPAAPGTMTLAAQLGMGVEPDFDIKEFVRSEVQAFLSSSDFRDSLKDGVRYAAADTTRGIAEREATAALSSAGVKSRLHLLDFEQRIGVL